MISGVLSKKVDIQRYSEQTSFSL